MFKNKQYNDLKRKYDDVCYHYGKQGEIILQRNRQIAEMLYGRIYQPTPAQEHNYSFALACLQCPPSHPNKIYFSSDENTGKVAHAFLQLLTPHKSYALPLMRIGGDHDGGYVMASPQQLHSSIAYSFGISDYSPWDAEIADMGIHVYQYDGTIEYSPNEGERIHFNKLNITASKDHAENEICIDEILTANQHTAEQSITLQIDIEGAEWDFFNAIRPSCLEKFSQIICEFHNIDPLFPDRMAYYSNIIKKITKSHTVVNTHSNNYGEYMIFDDFSVCPSLLEVSFVNKACGFHFTECEDVTSSLDMANLADLPDPVIIY